MLLLSVNAPTGVHGQSPSLIRWLYMVVRGYGTDACQFSMGFARLAETGIRRIRGKADDDKLGAMDKILASSVGGALATWNQPIEVIRVEVGDNHYYVLPSLNPLLQMQSMAKSANRPVNPTIMNTLAYIYKENGIKGLYRGVTPRIGLGIWQTICMVSFADYVKAWYGRRSTCCSD